MQIKDTHKILKRLEGLISSIEELMYTEFNTNEQFLLMQVYIKETNKGANIETVKQVMLDAVIKERRDNE